MKNTINKVKVKEIIKSKANEAKTKEIKKEIKKSDDKAFDKNIHFNN